MRSSIETVRDVATELLTNATSVATISSHEQRNITTEVDGTTTDRTGPWLMDTSESRGSKAASYASTESTRKDSIFSEREGSLRSPASEAGPSYHFH